MYDWANSAFATTILAAVLPVYYSQVAGATLPSPAQATAYWSLGVSVSLLLTAILSPILGTISDIKRGKKPFLATFIGIGVLGTGLMVFVNTGDWLLASMLFIVGRVGFSASIVFYDALLPHVAREEDQDMVSARGYAIGYLGGGLLLAINIAMIFLLPEDNWGSRLSFLSVAIWWAVFSIPLFRVVPEPPAATMALGPGENVLTATFSRLRNTFSQLRRYRELLKFLDRLPDLQRRHRHDHRGGGDLRGGAGLWGDRADRGDPAGAVCGYSVQPDLRAAAACRRCAPASLFWRLFSSISSRCRLPGWRGRGCWRRKWRGRRGIRCRRGLGWRKGSV
jgi:MFS family permease